MTRDHFFEQGWTDGPPIVPPTVIIEKLAVKAVMAGVLHRRAMIRARQAGA